MTKIKRKTNVQKHERAAIAKKKSQVESLAGKIKSAKVVAVVNLSNLPDRLLQSARKKLRGKAEFYQAKNTVFKRALEASGKGGKIADLLTVPSVLITTDMTPYSLFKFFKDNKSKVAAKPAQIAPFDIVVPEGETDLPPGPALSELKGAGINVQLKGGKIVVAKDSVVAKSGAKISGNVAKALQKLNILPFEVGLNMVAAYEGGYVYLADVLNIDERQLNTDLQAAFAQGLNVSINASFPTESNINMLLGAAFSQGRNIAANGKLYSDSTIELLFSEAYLQGLAVGKQAPASDAAGSEEKKA
ncbi:MAG: 50S ribosomal protein L10 [Candidatus Micrarchaeia archaeon]